MKKMGAKAVVVALAGVLAVGGAVGGTLAWLADKTETVVNTFTVGNVDITLEESVAGQDRVESFKMIPGATITKDPVVTVESGSEACWVFVEITEANSLASYIEYTVDSRWTPLVDTDANGVADNGVYYLDQPALTAEDAVAVKYSVLANDRVTVKPSVTKGMMDSLEESTAYPTLSFTAYAVQKSGISSAADAWVQAKNESNY